MSWSFRRQWRPSPKTIARLQELAYTLDLPTPHTYRRLYPGYWQRSAGAFLWMAEREDGVELFGSTYPLLDCLKAKVVEVYAPEHETTPELIPKEAE